MILTLLNNFKMNLYDFRPRDGFGESKNQIFECPQSLNNLYHDILFIAKVQWYNEPRCEPNLRKDQIYYFVNMW